MRLRVEPPFVFVGGTRDVCLASESLLSSFSSSSSSSSAAVAVAVSSLSLSLAASSVSVSGRSDSSESEDSVSLSSSCERSFNLANVDSTLRQLKRLRGCTGSDSKRESLKKW